MKAIRLLLPCLLALPGLAIAEAEPSAAPPAIDIGALNDSVAFLAGVPLPHSEAHPLVATEAWKRHTAALDRDFSGHRDRVLAPLSEWAAAEMPAALVDGSTVRYLFSGPDFIHVFHAFPTADTYILCGLEPVGEYPDLARIDESNATKALKGVENALSEIINLSFFRTNDMKVDLVEAMFSGTTPIISVFLARSGQYLKDLEFYKLSGDGTLASLGTSPAGADVVRIEFSPLRMQRTKTLYYFSTDLSDGGFESSGFAKWIEGFPKGNAYLKAASYLMHNAYFSKVRNHLLEHSYQIVGDDSGIPYRFFDADTWEAHLYGVYDAPIELFSTRSQPDLRAAYARERKPLNFGTGYKWRRGESNLMRFVRHDAMDRVAEEPADADAPAEAEDAPAEKAPEAP